MANGTNVNTTSTIIKQGTDAQPYELGNFVKAVVSIVGACFGLDECIS